jgi:uncharacterized protein YndB with AHSA1/START domain
VQEFELTTKIDRPPAQVFAALQNLEKLPLWNDSVTEVRRTSDGPLGQGSTVVYVGRFLGLGYERPSEYTEFTPDRSFTTRTRSGPFQIEVATSLEAVGGGTQMTLRVRGMGGGLATITEPLLKLIRRTLEHNYARFKALLEEGSL